MSRSLAGVRGQLPEVGAHCVLDYLAVLNMSLQIPPSCRACSLRRVQAEVRPEERHVFGLGEFGHLGFDHLLSFAFPGPLLWVPLGAKFRYK